jgi:hypothetical protein
MAQATPGCSASYLLKVKQLMLLFTTPTVCRQQRFALIPFISHKLSINKENIFFILFLQIAISITGFLANGITIVPLLLSKKLSSIFNRLLVCLAVFDNLFLTSCVLEAVRRFFVRTNFQVRQIDRQINIKNMYIDRKTELAASLP